MVTNNVSEGSCVTQGGTASYKTKLKYLYIRTTKCPIRHKNLDYWCLLNKFSPKTQNFDVFCTSWTKRLIKIRKLNNWPKCFEAVRKKKTLSLKILWYRMSSSCFLSSFWKFHTVVLEKKSKMSQPIRGRGGHQASCFLIGTKNTNLVEDVEFLLPVKFQNNFVQRF